MSLFRWLLIGFSTLVVVVLVVRVLALTLRAARGAQTDIFKIEAKASRGGYSSTQQ